MQRVNNLFPGRKEKHPLHGDPGVRLLKMAKARTRVRGAARSEENHNTRKATKESKLKQDGVYISTALESDFSLTLGACLAVFI